MSAWSDLREELRIWAREGLTLPIWWRDDDAIEPTPQLERLRNASRDAGLPVHLAIIPAHAKPDLADWLGPDGFRAVVHGWVHVNHAPDGAKSAEFGHPRGGADAEARGGLEKLRSLFGEQVHPMFVPPWNRIHTSVTETLASCGYTALSTYGPRAERLASSGLVRINTYIDPVDWRGTRGLADPDMILSRLVANLADRRAGTADGREPLGLLTHHLMQDDATWDFCTRLVDCLASGPVTHFDMADMDGTELP